MNDELLLVKNMATFGSQKMDIAVSVSAIVSGFITAAAGNLWSSGLLFIVACSPWLRIVTVSVLSDHRAKMKALRCAHQNKVDALKEKIKSLKGS
jgi:hypothetical protein